MDKNEQERIFSRMILQGRGHNMDSLNLANKAVAFEGPYCEMFSSKKVFSYTVYKLWLLFSMAVSFVLWCYK